MSTDLRTLASELNRGTWARGAISIAAKRGVLSAIAERACTILRALVPGGWLTTAAIAVEGTDLHATTARFRNAIWGGGVRRAPQVIAALEAAGFTSVMAAPSPPGAMVPVLARRPE